MKRPIPSRTSRRLRSRKWGTVAVSFAAGACPAFSQVVLDGKFGTSGALVGPDYSIGAGVGAIRGNNLFHSFTQFDLKAGESATFSGPANIQNILGRVTGGTPTSIDGAVRSGIQGANLFLINPSGMVFGPNASVDVSGSFAAGTANYLRLANGARFVAALDADDSALTTDPVVAFGFLEGAAGRTEVRGSWTAGPGGSLTAVGSSVTVAEGSRLDARTGQVRIVGAGTPGEIPHTAVASSPDGGLSAPGAGAGTGQIVIRAGRLVVDNAQVRSDTGAPIDIALSEGLEVLRGGQIVSSHSGSTKGGDVTIAAPSILIDGEDGAAPTRIAAETTSDVAGSRGGDVSIRAQSVELRRGAEISVSAMAGGDAGRVDLVTDSLRLVGSDFPQFPTQIAANAAPVIGAQAGAGGGVGIQARSIEIGNGAAIMASSMGDAPAGAVSITADSLVMNNGAITTFAAGAGEGGAIRLRGGSVTLDGPFASITAITTGLNGEKPAGAGGVIDVEVGSLRLQNDSAISANTFGDAKSGTVRVTADSIVLETASFQPGAIPGISAASSLPFFGGAGGGAGGDIEINAGSLALHGGMPISTTTATTGNGGSIRIKAGNIVLDGKSSIQAASTGSGLAGTLSIESARDVLLSGGGSISTSAPQSAGGDITIRSGGEVRLEGSQVTSQAGPGGGGNVTISAPSMVYLLDGTLTAQAVGDGGNLTLREPQFVVLNRSALISKSTSANGGNITLLSDYFLTSASVIDASAPFGLPGTVSVSAPDVDLSASLVPLPASLLDVSTLLQPDCGVRLDGGISSFVVGGRGGSPIQPGGFLPSGTLQSSDEKR